MSQIWNVLCLQGVTLVDFDAKKGTESAEKLNEQYGKTVALFCRADVTKESELKSKNPRKNRIIDTQLQCYFFDKRPYISSFCKLVQVKGR